MVFKNHHKLYGVIHHTFTYTMLPEFCNTIRLRCHLKYHIHFCNSCHEMVIVDGEHRQLTMHVNMSI